MEKSSFFGCCLIFLIACSSFGSCSENDSKVQNRIANPPIPMLPPITDTGALQQLFEPPSFGGLDVDFYNFFTSFVNQTRSTLPLIANHGNMSLIQLGLLGAVGAMATGLITIIAEAKYFREQQEELDFHKRYDVDVSQYPQTLKTDPGKIAPYKDGSNFIDNSEKFYSSDAQPSYHSNNYYSDSQSRKKRQVYNPKKSKDSSTTTTTTIAPPPAVRKRIKKKKIVPPQQDFQVVQSHSYDLPMDDFNLNETSSLLNTYPYYSFGSDDVSVATTSTTTTTTTTTPKPKSPKILTSVKNSGEEKDKDYTNNNVNTGSVSQPQFVNSNSYSPEDAYANYYEQLELEKQNYLNAQQYYQQQQQEQDYQTGSVQNSPVYKPTSQKDTNNNYYVSQAETTTQKSVPPQVLYQNPYTQNPLNENNYFANQDYPNKIYYRNISQSAPNWNSNYVLQLYSTEGPSQLQNSNSQPQQQFQQDYYQQVQPQPVKPTQPQQTYPQIQQVIPDYPPHQSSESQQFTEQRPLQAQSSQQQTTVPYPQRQAPDQNYQRQTQVLNPQIIQNPQQQLPVQNSQQQIPVRNYQQQIPVRNPQQQTPVRNPQQQTPVRNSQQQIPVRNPQQQVQVQNSQQQVQVQNSQQQIPVRNPQQQIQVQNSRQQIKFPNSQQQVQVANPQIQNPQQAQLASQSIQNSQQYIEEYLQEMHPPNLPPSNYIANNQQGSNRKNYYVPVSPPPQSLYEQPPTRPITFPHPQPNQNSNSNINAYRRVSPQNPYTMNNPYANANGNSNGRAPYNNYALPGRQDATTARSFLSKIFNPFDLHFPSRNKNSNFMKRTFWTPNKS